MHKDRMAVQQIKVRQVQCVHIYKQGGMHCTVMITTKTVHSI